MRRSLGSLCLLLALSCSDSGGQAPDATPPRPDAIADAGPDLFVAPADAATDIAAPDIAVADVVSPDAALPDAVTAPPDADPPDATRPDVAPPDWGLEVDEPVGPTHRYTLGLTLWHLAHDPEAIAELHALMEREGLSAEDLLPPDALLAPEVATRLLIEPARLPGLPVEPTPAAWYAQGDEVKSGPADYGPELRFPLAVPTAGFYRLWIRYHGWSDGTALTRVRLYRDGAIADGPVFEDEIHDTPEAETGPRWKDALLDLEAGDHVVRLNHVRRWWHAPAGVPYKPRRVGVFYLTDEVWAPAPDDVRLAAVRDEGAPNGDLQWVATARLGPDERRAWSAWRIRPQPWEARGARPALFELGLRLWREKIDAIARLDWGDAEPPDYRRPERQVVFDPDWNLVANPVRLARQIAALSTDVDDGSRATTYWFDCADFDYVPGLWSRNLSTGGCHGPYWDFNDPAWHSFSVREAGTYAVWVRFRDYGYFEPLRASATTASGARVAFTRDQRSYPALRDVADREAAWAKLGELEIAGHEPVTLRVEPIPASRAAQQGLSYRRVYDMVLSDDLGWTPSGVVPPPSTPAGYARRARDLGADPARDAYLLWAAADATTPLLQHAWPATPPALVPHVRLELPAGGARAVQLFLRSVVEHPLRLRVEPGPLVGEGQRRRGQIRWRVQAFVPHGEARQDWSPFALLRRPWITVPPLNNAAIQLTIDAGDLPPGEYTATVALRGDDPPPRTVVLHVRVSPIAATPEAPIAVWGWRQMPEGDAYLEDMRAHGLDVWHEVIPHAEFDARGLQLLLLKVIRPDPAAIGALLDRLSAEGYAYDEFALLVKDEPTGGDAATLADYIAIARAIEAIDPAVRVAFNPGEPATLATFQTLAPYADLWLPYEIHLEYPPATLEAKLAIIRSRPFLPYSTPVYADKSPTLPGQMYRRIRAAPTHGGAVRGVAFFAAWYPLRDAWDTAYEHLADAGVMVLPARHGPVATRTWEAIAEARAHADLAQLLKEATPEDAWTPALSALFRDGSVAALLRHLEGRPSDVAPCAADGACPAESLGCLDGRCLFPEAEPCADLRRGDPCDAPFPGICDRDADPVGRGLVCRRACAPDVGCPTDYGGAPCRSVPGAAVCAPPCRGPTDCPAASFGCGPDGRCIAPTDCAAADARCEVEGRVGLCVATDDGVLRCHPECANHLECRVLSTESACREGACRAAIEVRPEGTVADYSTGLLWARATLGDAPAPGTMCHEAPGTLSQPDAHAACAASALGGHGDWRLPTIAELSTLVRCREARHDPLPPFKACPWLYPGAADHVGGLAFVDVEAFPDAPACPTWASDDGWHTNFVAGVAGNGTPRDRHEHVRCVRGQ